MRRASALLAALVLLTLACNESDHQRGWALRPRDAETFELWWDDCLVVEESTPHFISLGSGVIVFISGDELRAVAPRREPVLLGRGMMPGYIIVRTDDIRAGALRVPIARARELAFAAPVVCGRAAE